MSVLHPLGTPAKVAVVKVQLLALQDEGPDAILDRTRKSAFVLAVFRLGLSYPADGYLLQRLDRHRDRRLRRRRRSRVAPPRIRKWDQGPLQTAGENRWGGLRLIGWPCPRSAHGPSPTLQLGSLAGRYCFAVHIASSLDFLPTQKSFHFHPSSHFTTLRPFSPTPSSATLQGGARVNGSGVNRFLSSVCANED